MMDGQFNPFIRESTPPVVINVKVKTHENWGWETFGFIPVYILKRAWAEIDMEMIDVAEFHVTVRISPGRVAEFEGEGHEWFKAELDLYLWEIAGKYKVKIEMVDLAGNELDPPYEEEVDGWFGGVLRMLEALWEFICAVVSAIADAVMKALSFIIDLIVSAFKAGIKALLDTITNMIEPPIRGIANQIEGIAAGGSFDPWQEPLIMAPLVVSLYGIYKNVRDTFDAMEKVDIALSAILMATGVGGAIKTILQKITLESVKKVLQKILIALTVGVLVESVGKLINRKEVEDWTKGAFGAGTFLTGTILGAIGVFELLGEFIGKRKTEGLGFKSRYCVAVALAVVGLALAVYGSVADVKGYGLQIMDGLAVAFEIIALMTLTAKWWGKIKLFSAFADTLVLTLGSASSTIEKVLVLFGATSTFISVAEHRTS
jgi:hypothetical protein